MTLRFTLLGPVGARANGRPVGVDRPRRRAVLAYLLLNTNQVVSVEQLTSATWGTDPPATARAQIQSEISALRRALARAGDPASQIATLPGGYRLELAPDQLDLSAYANLAARARADENRGNPGTAAKLMREAQALWRGPALGGAAGAFVAPNRERLAEMRLADVEWLVEVELALGRHRELITELTQLVAEHPLRERFRGQLMVALYRDGRHPEALRVGRQGRELLVDEHGLDPGPLLRELELAILRREATLDPPAPPTATVAAPVRPAQLPAESPVFAGRDRELAALVEQLRRDRPRYGAVARIVALEGMPGVGKSALALQVAHAVSSAFPDGQLYVDFAADGQQPAEVLAGWLRALGVTPAAVPVAPAEAVTLLRSIAAERRILFLFDGVSSVAQVQPLIPAAAGCAVMVATRRRLDLPGAHRHRVAPLAEADSRAVLAGYVDPARIDAEPEAAQHLLRECGGLPLALRLAASRLAAGRSIAELVGLLRDPRHRLDELSSGDGSMRAALQPSYSALSEPARHVLRRLATMPSASIPDRAVTVGAGLDRRTAMRVLDELVGHQLLTLLPRGSLGTPRYVLHDLVRCYALTAGPADVPAVPAANSARYAATLAAEAPASGAG